MEHFSRLICHVYRYHRQDSGRAGAGRKRAAPQCNEPHGKIGAWEFDPVTRKGTWTEETARIHDLDPNDETNVEKGLSFYQGEARKIIENAVNDAINKAIPYDLELELISAKGNHKWVRTIGNPIIENGRVVKVQGTFHDITESKKAEQALEQSNLFLNNIIEQSPLAMWISDAKGTLIQTNPRYVSY
jgi:PAS domain-containing protein